MAIFPGTPGPDTIDGTDDADTINGGAGNDTINANGGIDLINPGPDNDTVFGGTGSDILLFAYQTDGSDSVNLGEGFDAVSVSGGPGQIRLSFTSAEVGNASANDSNTPAPPQDGGLAVRFQAENGSDGLTGPVSRFDDEGIAFAAAVGGPTFDVRDLVSGAQRGDQFRAVVLGTQLADTDANAAALVALDPTIMTANIYVNLGQGDDSATTFAGNDFLVGGAGNDTLTGAGGNDSLLGGAGNDVANANISTDGRDSVDLGAGSDVVSLTAAAAGQIRLSFTSSEVGNANANDSNTMANQDGGFAVRAQTDTGDVLGTDVSRYDDEGITFVSGTAGVTFDVRDLVSGAARGDLFEVVTLGTEAGDTLTAVQAARPYYFNGGGGADTISGGTSNDFLVGGGGNDTLTDDVGNDSFIGGGGNDLITGGAGADVANVNVTTDGADSVNLGAGSDRVSVTAAAAGQIRLSFTSAEVGNGNANDSNTMVGQDGGLALRLQTDTGDVLGTDVSRYDDEAISFVSGTAGLTFDVRDLVSGAARGDLFEVVVLGSEVANTLTFAPGNEARPYYFNAGAGDDSVAAGTGADFLVGGAGADTLSGGDGADTFIGGGGNDSFNGGAGVDTVDYAGNGAAQGVQLFIRSDVSGNDGVGGLDVLNGVENVFGGSGGDSIVGDTSANLLRGNGANDFLFGGGFNPDGSFAPGSGADTLEGGAGDDALWGADGADSLTGGVGNDALVGGGDGDSMSGGDGNDFVFGGDFSAINGSRLAGSGNDTIDGGDGNDALYGFDGDDLITGGAGTEYVEAGEGNDTVNGGADNDTLLGQAGNDVINGGGSFDFMYGGAGADIFVLNAGDGSDFAFDFSKSDGDKVRIASTLATSFADFQSKLTTFTFQGADYTVFTAGSDQLTLGNIKPGDFTADMFVV